MSTSVFSPDADHKVPDLNGDLVEIACSTPLQEISWSVANSQGVKIYIKREDCLHPLLSGNKFYKLFYPLRQALRAKVDQVVSFGGAYSNHIHALAAAGQCYGLKTHGVIRGERPPQLSPTLRDVEKMGMQLHFVSRLEYRRRYDADYLESLRSEFAPCLVIPEGGAGIEGARGCQAIAQSINRVIAEDYDYLCCACGTGTTLAGLIAGSQLATRVLGFPVLKGYDQLAQDVLKLLPSPTVCDWQILNEFHCGGYAKVPPYLVAFIDAFERETGVPLDPVYMAKMMWGISQLIAKGDIEPGTRVVAIHSGGLQGRRGYPQLPPLITDAPQLN